MTKEDEQYYENYFELFNTKGWKQFIDEVSQTQDVLKDTLVGSDSTQLEFGRMQGRYTVTETIVNFKDYTTIAHQTITDNEHNDTL